MERSAQNAASAKARRIVSAPFRMPTASPVAWGATVNTARTNRRRTSLSLGSPFGVTDTRAFPSGLCQSATSSRGRFANVIRSGFRLCRKSFSVIVSGGISTFVSSDRTWGPAFASYERPLANVRAASAPSPWPCAAALFSQSAAVPMLFTASSSLGAGRMLGGFRVLLTSSAVCLIICSF